MASVENGRPGVVAAWIENAGRVLITQRLAQAALGGHWEFPGGKIEPGESDEAALAREIREELGADIEVMGFLRAFEGQAAKPGKTPPEIRVYRAAMKSNPCGLECLGVAAWAWVMPGELLDYDLIPANREFVRAVLASR